jgi:transcriptional regulator with XRE-family HTH domain
MNQSGQGAMIKQIRQQYGLTAQQLAEKAGVPLRVLYLMEIGCPVSTDDARKVLQALSALTSDHSLPSNLKTTME